MIRLAVAAIAALSLTGCVSTQMETFMGRPIQEAMLRYGSPENVVDMPDGARAFQFRYGGGAVMVPGYTQSTVTAYGNMATVNTTGMPCGVIQTRGCLLTFIARQENEVWIVREIRPPQELVC